MDTALVVIHFGEPGEPDRETVERYLTRIFLQNADLEEAASEAEAHERARDLARRRAPGLIKEYELIGGSPLNEQARHQAQMLADDLADRGLDPSIHVAFQFLSPTIEDVIDELHANDVDRIVALPIYPLCGPSTTVAALEAVDKAVETHPAWDVSVKQISGWHRHPAYLRLRANNIQQYVETEDIDLSEAGTSFIFSAHGTPMHYVESGSRYVDYVEETCETVAGLIGIDTYTVGYQNHENRDIPWTEPEIEEVVATLEGDRIVVEPVSFMHEQSETLVELDDELAEVAEEAYLGFHRVPIPHDDPAFPRMLADVVEPVLRGVDPAMYQLRPCQCKPTEHTYCLNAPRG